MSVSTLNEKPHRHKEPAELNKSSIKLKKIDSVEDVSSIKSNSSSNLGLHPSTEQNSNFLSRVFFCFISQYLWRTKGKTQDNDLLEQPLDRFKSKNAVNKLEKEWRISLKSGTTLFSTIFKLVGSQLSMSGLLLILEECVSLIQPICMGRLMAFFRPGSTLTTNDAYLAAAGVTFTSLLRPVIHHPYFYSLLKLGFETKVAVSSLLYKKGLKLTASSVQQTSTGQLINLLSTDTSKFEVGFMFIHYTWLSPFLLFAYGYVIWLELGPACIAGFLCLLLLIIIQSSFSAYMGINRRLIAERGDKRLSVMNEIISGIRVIKMYTWEDAFSEIVAKLRESEVKRIRLTSVFSACVMGVTFASGKIILLCALLVYIYLDNNITAERVFVASALYNSCRLPFSLFLPIGVHFLTEMRTTCQRVEHFLRLKEFSRESVGENSLNHNNINLIEKENVSLLENDQKTTPTNWKIDISKTNQPKISLKNVTTLWIAENAKETNKKIKKSTKSSKNEEAHQNELNTVSYGIRNVSFEATHGECIAVVGQVGSGKSSLLSSILGEAKLLSGSLELSGKVAYCTQEPWIFSGTVRDNILFGNPYEKDKYTETVEICLLIADFKQLKDGDMTEVGDRGSTLSGGQRARIALARAIYADADIYLLDDPLSAVDANVGRLLYKRLLTTYLKNKLVVLVTHQVQLLNDLPRVFLMKDNSLLSVGTIDNLKNSYPDLFVKLSEEKEKEVETEKPETIRSMSRLSTKKRISSTDDVHFLENDLAKSSDIVETFSKLKSTEKDDEADEEKNLGVVSKNRFKEERSTGSVPLSIYWEYIKEVLQSPVKGVLLIFFVLGTQLMFNFVDWWLNKWTTSAEKWNVLTYNETTMAENYDYYNIFGYEILVTSEFYQHSYTILTIFLFFFGIFRCIWFRLAQIGASRRLHSRMFEAVVNTDVEFFDSNSVGRILNRFSKDMNLVDDQIAFTFFEFVMGMLSFCGTIFMIIFLNPLVFLATVPIILAFGFVRNIYINRSRELKRIEATTRSPMNTHVSATLTGLSTIRAYGKEHEMISTFFKTQDMNTSASSLSLVSARWFAVCIDMLVASFITGVAFICVWQYSRLSSGEVALMLVYAVQLTGFFSWIMRQSADLQNGMVSVERIVEYTKLQSENKLRKVVSGYLDEELEKTWPSRGEIRFENVNVFYGSDCVLSNLNFKIFSRQKIGIAGRTGAGKSTLLRVLFGLKEITSGKIYIDNVDVDFLSLKFRRKNMAIIPQEPVLFIGTVRRNLDPFDNFSDETLWNALERCELKDVITEMGGLTAPMQEGGSNFSVGQRQLVCLARALIHRARILVIDEATANVDARTDAVIQNTISTCFAGSTVLTIAHRLRTIIYSDNIMVFDHGKLIEFDSPFNLLNNEKSALWNLAKQGGADNAAQLRKIAKKDC